MRDYHILQPLKSAPQPTNMIFYDCESGTKALTDNSNLQVYKMSVANFVRMDKKKLEDRERYVIYKDYIRFYDDVDQFCRQKTTTYLYAHNQHFDFNVSDGFNQLERLGWNLEFWVLDSDLFILSYSKDNKKLIVLDSFNYFKQSIDSLGEMFNIPKMKIDFKTASFKYLTKYCKRDVEILTTTILQFRKFLIDNDLGSLKYSLAATSFTSFRYKFMKDDIFIHNNQEIIDLERRSYTGGINLCFQLGKVYQELHVLDINSQYPSVMIDRTFPTKLKTFYRSIDHKLLKLLLERYLVIADVTLKTDKAIYPFKSERLIFPIGDFKTTLTTDYLKIALERGDIVKIGLTAVYEHKPIFKHFIEYYYNQRLIAKHKGNKVYAYMFKILMNSLYGKFGQQNVETKELEDVKGGNFDYEVVIDAQTKEVHKLYHLSGKTFERIPLKVEWKHSFPAICSHVTSYAQLLLRKYIDIAGEENVFYSDTDSIFVNDDGYLHCAFFLDNDKLGFLKNEHTSGLNYLLGNKDYILDCYYKIKGIRKSAVKINFNTYKQEQFLKSKSLMRKSYTAAVEVRQIEKVLKREYKKGNIMKNGRITPYVLSLKKGL